MERLTNGNDMTTPVYDKYLDAEFICECGNRRFFDCGIYYKCSLCINKYEKINGEYYYETIK